jgi:hypothetical protein
MPKKKTNLRFVRVKRKCEKRASSSFLQAAYFVNYCTSQAKKITGFRPGANNLLGRIFNGGTAVPDEKSNEYDDGAGKAETWSERRGRNNKVRPEGSSYDDEPPCYSKLYSNDSSGPASSWEAMTSTSLDSPT